jgi:hypothetical protein
MSHAERRLWDLAGTAALVALLAWVGSWYARPEQAAPTLVIENRLGSEWSHAVRWQAHQWQAAVPGLVIAVEDHPVDQCPLPAPGRIVVCQAPPEWQHKGYHVAGQVWVRVDGMGEAWVGDIAKLDLATLCHELGHALAGIDHTGPPAQSCVATASTRYAPGSHDVLAMRQVWS